MGARPLCLSACLSLSLCHSPGGAPACEVRDSIASEYFRRYSESFCECVRDSAAASSPHPPTFSSGGSPGEHIRPLRDGRTLDRKRERGRGTHRWILWRSRASVANASRRGGCCIAPWCALSEADQPMAGSWALSLLWVRLGSRSIGVASGWAATCVSRTRTPTAFCQLRGQVRQRSRGPRTKEVNAAVLKRDRHERPKAVNFQPTTSLPAKVVSLCDTRVLFSSKCCGLDRGMKPAIFLEGRGEAGGAFALAPEGRSDWQPARDRGGRGAGRETQTGRGRACPRS